MKEVIIILLHLTSIECFSQNVFPELSPKGKIEQRVGLTDIRINYERPAARGRKVFGELVPYETLWRTGAGNCTKIYFSQPVTIGNKKISRGTYSLFTIPGKTEWTVILNTDTSLYGTSSYDSGKDLLRFKVNPRSTERYFESVTIDIDVVPDNALLYIAWEKTQISFPIETETEKNATDFIKANLLNDKSTNAEEYGAAAEYHYFYGKDPELALTLINKAIQLKKEAWFYRQKVDILEKLKRYQEAIDCAELAISLNEQRTDWDRQSKNSSRQEYEKRIKSLKSRLQ